MRRRVSFKDMEMESCAFCRNWDVAERMKLYKSSQENREDVLKWHSKQ